MVFIFVILVFLDESGTIKIGDFGLATVKRDPLAITGYVESITISNKSNAEMTSDIGTPVYAAPEILHAKGRYNSKVDMYSLGILFFELNYKMNTFMQRSIVLRDLRHVQIKFPSGKVLLIRF
jgi:translation initiation factor 2-alpha kinase 4